LGSEVNSLTDSQTERIQKTLVLFHITYVISKGKRRLVQLLIMEVKAKLVNRLYRSMQQKKTYKKVKNDTTRRRSQLLCLVKASDLFKPEKRTLEIGQQYEAAIVVVLHIN